MLLSHRVVWRGQRCRVYGSFSRRPQPFRSGQWPRKIQQVRRVRIIVFGAHPDDCELEAGGTAARWSKLGYKVKFVSVTNGDIGHHQLAGAPLASAHRRRRSRKCTEIPGIETEV